MYAKYKLALVLAAALCIGVSGHGWRAPGTSLPKIILVTLLFLNKAI
jgi:hypothetical protein